MTLQRGTADTSGGRWGMAKNHAVRPGTERLASKRFSVSRGTAFCGADVHVFSDPFESDHPYNCKRCTRAVENRDH